MNNEDKWLLHNLSNFKKYNDTIHHLKECNYYNKYSESQYI